MNSLRVAPLRPLLPNRLWQISCRVPVAVLLVTILSSLYLFPTQLFAHPLGNFTVNRYSNIAVGRTQLQLTHILDMAEIPAHQERTQMDSNGDGTVDKGEEAAYLATLVTTLQDELVLTVNGTTVPLTLVDRQMTFPVGQAGLPTLRVVTDWQVPLAAGASLWQVAYTDNTFADRLGWQEVIVQGGDAVSLLESSAPTTDLSAELTSYPEDMLQSPPAVNQASFRFAPAGVANAPSVQSGEAPTVQPLRTGLPVDPFAELINIGTLSPLAILLALLAAFGWGAAHAFSPGHGKTVVAAYLVGSRGTVGHALFLGVTTTITHTAGVFALGVVTLFASRFILPETLYPWLSVLSGLLVAAIGITMIRERWSNPLHSHHHHNHTHDHAHEHSHDHEHHSHGLFGDHHHGEHGHDHSHSHLPPGANGGQVTWRSLLALGISGGLLPCPSALVLMLGAISLQRIGFGLALIVLFSLGLASVLTLIGVTLVYAGKYFQRIPESGPLLRLLPVASAVFITIVGLGITIQALLNTGTLRLS
ncbi:MAG: hypothetical protein KDE19_02230 [Caldilineaceae bacterium]|nr:hypothetical protein [Caldilineaceae bacterium]